MTENIIAKMSSLEADHAPDGYPAVTMSEISQLLGIIDGMIPALDLLQGHLSRVRQAGRRSGRC